MAPKEKDHISKFSGQLGTSTPALALLKCVLPDSFTPEDNIASNWQSQYLPEDDVYTGSKNDGPGDPQATSDALSSDKFRHVLLTRTDHRHLVVGWLCPI